MASEWDLTIGVLEPMAVALYVRDALQLELRSADPIPGVSPPAAPRLPLPAREERDSASAELTLWWEELLTKACRREGMGELAQWESRHEGDLARHSILHAVARPLMPEAVAWARRRREDFAAARRRDIFSGGVPMSGRGRERQALNEISRSLRRWMKPLSLRLVVLPVLGSAGWRIGLGCFFVSTPLVLDERAFVAGLRSIPRDLPLGAGAPSDA
jgi:hypothetical protein